MRRFLDLPVEARLALGRAGRQKMRRQFDQTIVVDRYRQAVMSALRAQ
jgi:hypothetical protein